MSHKEQDSDADKPSFGVFVLAGPTSGKTHICQEHEELGTIVDTERVLAFTEETLQSTRSVLNSRDWPLSHFFFAYAVPLIIGCLKTDRVVAQNLVTPENVGLVTWLVRGLTKSWPGSVCLFDFRDERLMEERVRRRVCMIDEDGKRRESSLMWGKGGYLWTFQCHALLHGLASLCPGVRTSNDLEAMIPRHLPPLPELMAKKPYRWFSWTSSSESQAPPPTSSSSSSSSSSQIVNNHCLVEVVPDLYLEFINEFPRNFYIVDHYTTSIDAPRPPEGSVALQCLACTKHCLNNHPRPCTMRIQATEESSRVQVSFQASGNKRETFESALGAHARLGFSFVPLHHLKPWPPTASASSQKPCVLAFYGSLAPMHRGHLECLDIATTYLQQEKGYQVLGAFVTPVRSVSSSKKFMIPQLQAWRDRALIAELLLSSYRGGNFAVLDPHCKPFLRDFSQHFIHDLAARLRQASGQELTVVWVNGSDAFYAKDYISEEQFASSAADVRLLVIPPRSGASAADNHFVKAGIAVSDHIWYSSIGQQLAISSTRIRKLIRYGRLSEAAELIGNEAAAAHTFFLFQELERQRERAIEEQRQSGHQHAAQKATAVSAPSSRGKKSISGFQVLAFIVFIVGVALAAWLGRFVLRRKEEEEEKERKEG